MRSLGHAERCVVLEQRKALRRVLCPSRDGVVRERVRPLVLHVLYLDELAAVVKTFVALVLVALIHLSRVRFV